MTLPLTNGGGQASPGLTQDRAGMGLGTEAGLGKDDRNPARREDAAEMAVAAAFQMQLATARAAAATQDDENEVAVVAVPVPPPIVFGLADDAAPDPAARRVDVAALTQKLVGEVDAADRLRLSNSGPVNLTLPVNAPSLGLAEVRLVVSGRDVTVVFPLQAGTNPAVVNAALSELAQALTLRFPQRNVRIRSEEEQAADPSEFNPFKEPVGRRK